GTAGTAGAAVAAGASWVAGGVSGACLEGVAAGAGSALAGAGVMMPTSRADASRMAASSRMPRLISVAVVALIVNDMLTLIFALLSRGLRPRRPACYNRRRGR